MTSVRLATRNDADGVMRCLRMMHDENGLFTLAEDRVKSIISNALVPPRDMVVPPMIGVIGDKDIEATICLTLSQLYYTSDWHLADLWCYIRPDCRKKMYIDPLLEFAKECSDKVGVPLLTSVISNKRTEAKIRIFSRHFGVPLGAAFIYKPQHKAS